MISRMRTLLSEKSWVYERIVLGILLLSSSAFLIYLVYGWYGSQVIVKLYDHYDSLIVVSLFHLILVLLGTAIYILVNKFIFSLHRNTLVGAPAHFEGIGAILAILLIGLLGLTWH